MDLIGRLEDCLSLLADPELIDVQQGVDECLDCLDYINSQRQFEDIRVMIPDLPA